MGVFESCLSSTEELGAAERAVIELYEEDLARSTSPGFDDVLGEPFLADADDDGLGDRVRPGTEKTVKAIAEIASLGEQEQDQVGNAPTSSVTLTLFEKDLKRRGLLSDGVCSINVNDRLLRLENRRGTVRVDFSQRGGLFCFEIAPGDTGSGIWVARFEERRAVGT